VSSPDYGGIPVTPAQVISFPVTAAGDMGFEPDGVLSAALTLQNQAGAVNGLVIQGSSTGNPVVISAAGTDSAVSINITPKVPGGKVNVTQGGLAVVGGTASDTLSTTGAITGGSTITATTSVSTPLVTVTGAGNDLTIAPNTTGSVYVTGGAASSPGNALRVSGVSSGINYITVTNAATGGVPSIIATGGDANLGLSIQAGGSGTSSVLSFTADHINFVSPAGTKQIFDASGRLGVATWAAPAAAQVSVGPTVQTTAFEIDQGTTNTQPNWLTVQAAASGSGPVLTAKGTTDTNIDIVVTPLGTGNVNLNLGASGALQIAGSAGSSGNVLTSQGAGTRPIWQTPTATVGFPLTNAGDETFQPNGVASNTLTLHNNASAVNGVTITGTIATAAPIIAASGSDTNLALTINSKGTGNISVYTVGTDTGSVMLGGAQSPTTVGRAAFTATGVASGVNGITATQAAAGAGVTLAATGSDTNIALTINSKGSGGLTLAPTGSGNIFLNAKPASGGQVTLQAGGNSVLQTTGVTSGAQFVVITNATSGNGPIVDANGGVTLNIGTVTATGVQIGRASQFIGMYGATPVARAAAITGPAATASTNVTPFGYTTSTQADAIVTAVNSIITALKNIGVTL
jgi:hypothetical protein